MILENHRSLSIDISYNPSHRVKRGQVRPHQTSNYTNYGQISVILNPRDFIKKVQVALYKI